MNKRFRVWKIN